jgi:hypothetical protein
MTDRTASINKNALVDPLPYEVDEFIRRITKHAEVCECCRTALRGKGSDTKRLK